MCRVMCGCVGGNVQYQVLSIFTGTHNELSVSSQVNLTWEEMITHIDALFTTKTNMSFNRVSYSPEIWVSRLYLRRTQLGNIELSEYEFGLKQIV